MSRITTARKMREKTPYSSCSAMVFNIKRIFSVEVVERAYQPTTINIKQLSQQIDAIRTVHNWRSKRSKLKWKQHYRQKTCDSLGGESLMQKTDISEATHTIDRKS